MHPILFRVPESVPLLGGYTVSSFGVMLYLAFVAGGLVLHLDLNRKGLKGEKAWDLVLWSLVGGLVGAKLYWVAAHYPQFARDPGGTLFSGEGLTWYGGFFVGLGAFWVGTKVAELPLDRTLDSLALGLPLGIALGRVGCFLAGDDYGQPTGSAFGVSFPEGHPPTRVDVLESRYGIEIDPALIERFGDVVPVHPTQLYEVGLSLIVFATVFFLRKHPHRAGWLFAVWAGLYGAQRFLVEIVRIKDDRIFMGLSVAQVVSLGMIAAAVYAVDRLKRKAPRAT